MTSTSGDASTSHDARPGRGLAGVFKGLTSSRPGKLSTPTASSTSLFTLSQATAVEEQTGAEHADHTADVEATLDRLRNGNIYERKAAAESLCADIGSISDDAIMQGWTDGRDLVHHDNACDVRQAGWGLFEATAKIASLSDQDRRLLYKCICGPIHSDDGCRRLDALVSLTNHGRNLSGFDYDVFPQLAGWLSNAYEAARTARKISKGKTPIDVEQQVLNSTFDFIKAVIKANFKLANDDGAALLDTLLKICTTTNNEGDLSNCIQVLDHIITYGIIAEGKLAKCVEILSSTYCLVGSLEKSAWHTLSNFLKSHHGGECVQILLGMLRDFPSGCQGEQTETGVVGGALKVFGKLLWEPLHEGYPSVALVPLVEGMRQVVTQSDSSKLCAQVLKLVNVLFGESHEELHPLLANEGWRPVLTVVQVAAMHLSYMRETPMVIDPKVTAAQIETRDSPIRAQLDILLRTLEMGVKKQACNSYQRHEIMGLYIALHSLLSEAASVQLLEHLDGCRCCNPSDLDWQRNLSIVRTSYYLDRGRPTEIRLKALSLMISVYELLEMVHGEDEEEESGSILEAILSALPGENATNLITRSSAFIVRVARASSAKSFGRVRASMEESVNKAMLGLPRSESVAPPKFLELTEELAQSSSVVTPANIITRACVDLFVATMNDQGFKAVAMYKILITIAKDSVVLDARLTAQKFLFRLRADWAYRVYVTPYTESEDLASVLLRTTASLSRRTADEAQQQAYRISKNDHAAFGRPTRSGQSLGTLTERMAPSRAVSESLLPPKRYEQLWCTSDDDGLESKPSAASSSVLCVQNLVESQEDSNLESVASLDLTLWADAILLNFNQDCNWEVYSMCLVYLSSQLSNHALWEYATPRILEMRRVLSERIRTNALPEPPAGTSVKRADVAICVYQTLTTLLSYSRHFQKSDEDDMVRTFTSGIMHQTARTCIHALSICCHEIPMATERGLHLALSKMQTVITSPFVAMHILEFLAGLARLPALYTNWREDDFRVVFGMCFRYLDTVRDKRRQARNSGPNEPSTPITLLPTSYETAGMSAAMAEDLPQYVYALAHHVVVFWFLALRMPDRANYVGWITKKLMQDPDSGSSSDEQAQVTIDFMQRATFAECDESSSDSQFLNRAESDILEKTWLIGNSIMTLQQIQGSEWTQIVKRQPSGTTYTMVRENVRPRPAYQEASGAGNDKPDNRGLLDGSLPRHLMVQLLFTMPQSYDPSSRPIPLKDDEALRRSLRSFDRISVVDGHKIGIIYIGEGQTQQAEILQNVAGSRDYVTFLNRIGTLTRLKDADFNAQGLDRVADADGPYAFCWRDRVSEIVFHVTTQMPTHLENDAMCNNKKLHIGNDFVNIIFNDSGIPFDFHTFPSAFGYVYIVISPESRASFVADREHELSPTGSKAPREAFFKVQVLSKEGFPEISPAAATKMVSLKALPTFVRALALNASVFCAVWANRGSGDDWPSSWRTRLREIRRLRERYSSKAATPVSSPPPTSGGGGFMGFAQGFGSHSSRYHAQTDGPPAAAAQPPAASRPSSSFRDSFTSMRRGSTPTFLTSSASVASTDLSSQRTSMASAGTVDTEVGPMSLDAVVESLDFTKWA